MPPDPAFLFHVYQDEPLAERLIGELRTHYPDADILCLGDGPVAEGFSDACQIHNVTFHPGDRLKPMEHGGQWCDRAFQFFLSHSQSPILVKLDPDSRLWKPFTAFPATDWFGDVRPKGFFRPLIRGGCMGFSRSVVERITSSGSLSNPIYARLPFGYLRYSVFRWPDETPSEEWVGFSDGILADVMFRLGIPPVQWSEVCIKFRDTLPADLSPYSVTHPHHHA